jgi:hypothetical protein
MSIPQAVVWEDDGDEDDDEDDGAKKKGKRTAVTIIMSVSQHGAEAKASKGTQPIHAFMTRGSGGGDKDSEAPAPPRDLHATHRFFVESRLKPASLL